MSDPIRVAVSGAAGRMGQAVVKAVTEADGLELAGQADPSLGTTLEQVLAGEAPEGTGDAGRGSPPDVLVEFSTPDTVAANALAAVNAGVHAVVGATGFDLDQMKADVDAAPGEAKCFVAPNFAIGAVLMMQFAQQAAAHMPEVEIIELHHDRKLDAPSGTAKRTAELITEAGGSVHEPIHSVRLPGIVANQEVIFGAEGQTLTIRHDSIDRVAFMPGVVLACRKVGGMDERFVVGLEKLL